MDDDGFWRLLAEIRHDAGNDSDLTSRLLFRRLRKLDGNDIADFTRLWERIRSRLYSWPVTDAACLLLGSIEEEDLRHIQNWVISYGRETVEQVAGDPDGLVDLATDASSARAQWFDEFITEAHILVTGDWPLGHYPEGPDDLMGAHTDFSDQAAVHRRFPRLTAHRHHHPELGAPQLS
ncbi:DUF4240 domain-containing protein [Actinoplanes missouriensis]|uniref:DUF4240 domain-containing protein n=1 Tax=Actinoplanes missouriensis TaxID=1866 RepID=UPI0033C01794